jgi:hypothetical protein
MPVRINSISIVPELSTNGTDYLLGNKTGKMIATIDCEAIWRAEAGLTADGLDMEFIAPNKIKWNGGNFELEGFLNADTISIKSTLNNGSFTITSLNGDEITVLETIVNEVSEDAIINGEVECAGVNFRYNLIENSEAENYLSKVDGNELRFSKSGIDYTNYTPVSLIQQGVYKSNHLGSATIKGVQKLPASGGTFIFRLTPNLIEWTTGDFAALNFSAGDQISVPSGPNAGTYTVISVAGNILYVKEPFSTLDEIGGITITAGVNLNRFVITHEFYITPFFLLGELADLENSIPPSYFYDLACLKYIYNIELLYNLSNPNKKQVSNAAFQLGNTGDWNENFNGGSPEFTIDSIVFKKAGVVIPYADYNAVTDVEISVTSLNSVIAVSSTRFILNHFILPEAETEYKNTSTDFETNFMFDRALQTVDYSPVNGDQYGGSKQVLTDIVCVYHTSSFALIKAKIDLSGAYKTRIASLTNRKFILSVTIADHLKQTETSDVVALRNSIQSYGTNGSNPNVGSITTVFNSFPNIAVDQTEAGMFVEDTLRGKSIIGVNILNGALIKDITVNIVAEKTSSFTLQEKNFSFSAAIVQSGVQMINIVESRGFILGSTNPFNIVSLKRRSDLDAGNIKYYELIYSFKIRWEDFVKLSGVNSEFYDITKKFNGFNQNWNRYFAASGWFLKYVVQANIEENSYVNLVEKESNLSAYNYQEGTDWTQTVKIYDIDTAAEIPNNILSDKIVRVVAEFTKASGSLPDIADVDGLIEVEPFEKGGEGVIRNINTIYEHEAGSPFISVLGNKLLKKENATNVYTFTANIDGRLLTGSPKLSARIYDAPTVAPLAQKEFQDGDDFKYMDGDDYEFMD